MIFTVKEIVGSNFVKYNKLAELLPLVYKNSDADAINLFVDLYPIYRSVFSNTYEVVVEDSVDITAGVINLCAHYRSFLFRKYGVESTIYLISGLNCPKVNNTLVPNYNRGSMVRFAGGANGTMKNLLKNSISMLDMICPYLNDVHFIQTKYETSVCILGIIDFLRAQGKAKGPNLVISKDAYPLQLPLIDPSITYLRPKKNKNGDHSYIVMNPSLQQTTKYFWDTYYGDRNTGNVSYEISPYNSNLLTCLAGMKQRSIPLIFNISKSREMIKNLVGDKDIQCSVNSLYEANEKLLTEKHVSLDMLVARYHALDAKFIYEAFYKDTVENKTYVFENKFDPRALMMINTKYFQNNPLDLERI